MKTEIFDIEQNKTSFAYFILSGEPTEYNRAPKTDLALGRGFDPVDLSSIKRPGISFTEKRIDGGGAAMATYESLYVSNYQSFTEELKIDSTINASYLGNSIDSAIKHSYDNSFSTNSVTVIVKAWADYGRWSLDSGAKLTDEAKELLTQNPVEFIKVYGSRYIATESRMNAIYIVITVHSVSSFVKKRMESTLTTGIGIGRLASSAKEAFINEIKNTIDSERISVNVYAIGGNGLAGFKDIVINSIKNEKDPLTSIGTAIANTIGQMDSTNAIPYSYLVADMLNFGLEQQPEIQWSYDRARALKNLSGIYERGSYKLQILKEIKNKTHPLYYLMDDPNRSFDESLQNIPVYENYLFDIKNRHENCRKNIDPSSYSLPFVNYEILSDIYLDFLKSPTIQFYGYNFNTDDTQSTEIRTEVLETILNVDPQQRNALIHNFFPNSIGLGVNIQPTGTGLTVMSLYDELKGFRPYNGQKWDASVIGYTGNASGSFQLIHTSNTYEKLENTILVELFKRRPLIIEHETIQFEYKLFCSLVDKAQRKYNYLLMSCSITAVWGDFGEPAGPWGKTGPTSADIAITYYPMPYYLRL
jgi:hypothetical protein